VFGGKTAGRRNAEMRQLLNSTIRKASTKRTRNPAPASFYRATPPKPAKPPAADKPVASDRGTKPVMTASSAPALKASSSTPTISIAKVRHVSIAPAAGPPDGSSELAAARGSTTPAGVSGPSRVALGRAPSTLQAQAESLSRGDPAPARPTFTSQAQPAAAVAQPDQALAVPAAAQVSASRPSSVGGYHVQVGAYTTVAEAKK